MKHKVKEDNTWMTRVMFGPIGRYQKGLTLIRRDEEMRGSRKVVLFKPSGI